MAKKILIVDDDAMNLRMAEFILKQKSYEVEKAASGDECIQLLTSGEYDLILLDIEMPGKNGFETLKEIRESSKAADIHVAFLSASEDEHTLEAVKQAGVKEYIKKPFLPGDLQKQVADILGE